MREAIQNKQITHVQAIDKTTRTEYQKISFFDSLTDTLSLLIDQLRFAQDIKLDIFNQQLPDEILNELKWLAYYGSNIKVFIKDDKVLNQAQRISRVYGYDLSIRQNQISFIVDDHRQIYILGQQVTHYISVDDIIRQHERNPIILFYTDSIDALTMSSEHPSLQINHISHIKNRVYQSKTAYYAEGSINRGIYIMINNRIYEYSENDKGFIESMQKDLPHHIYIPTELKTYDNYVIINNKFEHLKRGSKILHIETVASSFDEYLQANININFDELIHEWINYDGIKFEIELLPPLSSGISHLRMLSEYNAIDSLINDISLMVNKASENSTLDITLMMDQVKKIIDDSCLTSNSKLLKLNDMFKDFSEMRKKLEVMYKKDASTLYQMHMKESFDSKIQLLEMKLYDDEDIKDKLNLNSDENIIESIKDQITKLKAFKDQYVKHIHNVDFKSSVNNLSIENQNNILDQASSSLNRIIKNDQESHDDFLTMINSYKLVLHISERVKGFYSHFVNQIPSVGILYRDRDDKNILVIRYEDEIEQALVESKRYNASIYVERIIS